MNARPLAAVVMAAGLGTRMRSAVPKHLHSLLGRRMVDWVVEAVRPLQPRPVVIVASPDTAEAVADLGGLVAVQERPLGTGDAVRAAGAALVGFEGDVLILPGDAPLLTPGLLADLLEEHRARRADVTVLSFRPADPGAYGRIVRGEDGSLAAIVEAADAAPEELAGGEANSSVYAFSSASLWPALSLLQAENAQGELYLTDTVRHIVAAGGRAAVWQSPDPVQPLGVNTRAELAAAAAVLRRRINEAHLLAGVGIVDPETTWIDAAVELAPDSVIHPFTILRGRTTVERGAEIGPHAVVVDSRVGEGALVGPFCYLRPGTVLGAGAKAGTFVEVKSSTLGDRARVPHLSYIGDADIGEDSNIAAGAITANLPHEAGRGKQRTRIGRNVRTGVDNAFIAPVTIGDNAWVAAGSVITDDVPANALAIARARQVNKEGYVRGERGR